MSRLGSYHCLRSGRSGTCGVEGREELAVDLDPDDVAIEGDDHGSPGAWIVLGGGFGGCQRVDGAGAMERVGVVVDLDFVAVVDGPPAPESVSGSDLALRRVVWVVGDSNVNTRVVGVVVGAEDDADLAIAEFLGGVEQEAESLLVGLGFEYAVFEDEAAAADLLPDRQRSSVLPSKRGRQPSCVSSAARGWCSGPGSRVTRRVKNSAGSLSSGGYSLGVVRDSEKALLDDDLPA